MIRFEENESKEIVNIEHNDVRAYNILCPKCYSEWRYDRGRMQIWVWLHTKICGKHKTLEDIIQVPCGCYMSVWDILHTSILVDELISKPISRINKSGYLTKFSCSGHMHDPYAYVRFLHNYDELVHYITGNTYLSNVLSVEVELNGRKKGVMDTYEWDLERQSFVKTNTIDHGKNPPLENMTIRLNKSRKMANLPSMLLFRRCLNKIAKWCEETKAYKDKMDFSKNFERKYLSKYGGE